MTEDEVAVTCRVDVEPKAAFTVFTEAIDDWWVRRPVLAPDSVVRFEGDRLVAANAAGTDLLATVRSWDPPREIVLDWAGPYGQPDDVVHITFTPESGGTRVTVRHRRTGLRPQDTTATVIGLWWGDLLSRFGRPR